MKNLLTKVLVTAPPSADEPEGFYYRNEHEWRFLSQLGSDWFEALLVESFALAQSLANKGGNRTAVFDAISDVQTWPSATLTGITAQGVVEFQLFMYKKEGELLGIAKKKEDEKIRRAHPAHPPHGRK